MSNNLWSANTPASFWMCEPDPPASQWQLAIQKALPILELPLSSQNLDELSTMTLGEGQFGADHWTLSNVKKLYYTIKPLLPYPVRLLLRRIYQQGDPTGPLAWPIERRYADFLWEVMRQLLQNDGQSSLSYRQFWPENKRYAFVLTHDVEGKDGQDFIPKVAELEESLGFRSVWNFVPERYPLDRLLMQDLRDRGFEVGVHGLYHDGNLFRSHAEWKKRVKSINTYVRDFQAQGFRAPLTIRHPYWMQDMAVEYDSSFFDTDPYEPLSGGTMSLWPFFMGHLVELPYTLALDSTLFNILGDRVPDRWLAKAEFVAQYHGMVLMITHPDYLRDNALWKMYSEFLHYMKDQQDYWHALPCEVAQWWRDRADRTKSIPLAQFSPDDYPTSK